MFSEYVTDKLSTPLNVLSFGHKITSTANIKEDHRQSYYILLNTVLVFDLEKVMAKRVHLLKDVFPFSHSLFCNHSLKCITTTSLLKAIKLRKLKSV